MLNRTSRYLLAALEAVIGWEWLMSGGNKVLAGTFPQGLADALNQGIKGNPDGWYVNFLQHIILPHSVFYGYLIEWTELLAGLILLSAALILPGQPRKVGDPQHGVMVGYCVAAVVAAIVGAFLTVNFHFFQGGWVLPGFDPGSPYNEGIDLDALIPPLSLIVVIANIAFVRALGQTESRQQVAHLTRQDAREPVHS
jgi:thiosulfate dehydrogenase [quinone] large subunit